MNPIVTFVVPCYKLAHLLSECVSSILDQTFENFEILVMDDCSPDNTPQVAQSFTDPRVKHVRNNPNLGHLRNYNKGIGLARGKYVWLISADDRLRSPFVLERFVKLLDANPKVGYVFCPAVRLEDGLVGGVLDYSVHASHDAIWDGRKFLEKLVLANTIVAPTVLVRKECYDNVSFFPLDMPWGGDWYLWCVFALRFDVGYLCEPMVCYRRHTGSMTNQLTTQSVEVCASEDVEMPWIIKKQVEAAGHSGLSRHCLKSAAEEYARSILSKTYKTATALTTTQMSLDEFEDSLCRHTSDPREQNLVRALAFASLGNRYSWRDEPALARQYYGRALKLDPWKLKIWLKLIVSSSGPWGNRFRKNLAAVRRTAIWGR